MEFLTAPLASDTHGACHGCNASDTRLTASVMQIADHLTLKNALRQPVKTGVRTYLICEDCADSHPLWKLNPGADATDAVTA